MYNEKFPYPHLEEFFLFREHILTEFFIFLLPVFGVLQAYSTRHTRYIFLTILEILIYNLSKQTYFKNKK
jgi:hypothetical protein